LPSDHGHDCKPVDEQRGGVVQQAFAFEDLQQPVRQLYLSHHRGGRGCVGRRNDRASAIATGHGISGTSQRAASATASTVVPTAATTSPAIGRQFARRSRNEVS